MYALRAIDCFYGVFLALLVFELEVGGNSDVNFRKHMSNVRPMSNTYVDCPSKNVQASHLSKDVRHLRNTLHSTPLINLLLMYRYQLKSGNHIES